MTSQVNDLMMEWKVLQRANRQSKLVTQTGGTNNKWPGTISEKGAKEAVHRNNQNLILWKDKMIDILRASIEKEKEKKKNKREAGSVALKQLIYKTHQPLKYDENGNL